MPLNAAKLTNISFYIRIICAPTRLMSLLRVSRCFLQQLQKLLFLWWRSNYYPLRMLNKKLDQTSLANWRAIYKSNDIFMSSDLWYTELHHRKHSIFTTLLGFALQTFVPRVKSRVNGQKSLHVHFMVDFIVDHDNQKLF